jgi:predicted Zn-dependent protease
MFGNIRLGRIFAMFTPQQKPFILLFLLLLLFLFACASRQTVAENDPDLSLFELEEEKRFGYYVDAIVANYYPTYKDEDLTQKVARIGNKVASVSCRQDLDFTFKILNTSEVNAFAGPGGFVYITIGLLDILVSKDELAAVFSHEIGHICERHSVRFYDNTQRMQGFLSLLDLAAMAAGMPPVAKMGGELMGDYSNTIANLTEIIITEGYDSDWETTADEYGIIYTAKAGYDPGAFLAVLERLRNIHETEGDEFILTLLVSHPSLEERIEHLHHLTNRQSDRETDVYYSH